MIRSSLYGAFRCMCALALFCAFIRSGHMAQLFTIIVLLVLCATWGMETNEASQRRNVGPRGNTTRHLGQDPWTGVKHWLEECIFFCKLLVALLALHEDNLNFTFRMHFDLH